MSDLISRQAAIDAIRKSASEFSGFMEMEMYTDDDAVEAINGVPSAESVRHGKWRFVSCATGLRCQCSECLHWVDAGTDRNYCPNCGARMDKERKEE